MRELAIPHVPQQTGYTCGPASLCAVLRYYGHRYIGEKVLAKRARTTAGVGTTTDGMMDAARSYGIRPWKWPEMTLDVLECMNRDGHPVIAAVQAWHDGGLPSDDYASRWDDGHYVVVTGIDDRHVVCMDPSLRGARAILTHAEFMMRWHDLDMGEVINRFGILFPIGTPRWRQVGKVQRMG